MVFVFENNLMAKKHLHKHQYHPTVIRIGILTMKGELHEQLRKINSKNHCVMLFFIRTILKENPAGIYLLKVNNRNTRTKCEICSKLTLNIFHTLF